MILIIFPAHLIINFANKGKRIYFNGMEDYLDLPNGIEANEILTRGELKHYAPEYFEEETDIILLGEEDE